MPIIKNAIVLKAQLPDIALLRQQLEAAENSEIADTERRRDAFIQGNPGEMVSEFPSGFSLSLRCQEKIIPVGTISEAFSKRTEEIEQERGEPLSDEEHNALYEDVAVEIYKKAFVKTRYVQGFYHIESEFLFINTSSPGDVDRFMGSLIKVAGKVQTVTIHISGVKNGVTTRLQRLIAAGSASEEFPFGQLEPVDMARIRRKIAPGEPVEVVTYKGTWLATNDELLHQLCEGFEVEEIGLTFPPAAMSFRLTHQFRFKGISFAAQEREDGSGEGDAAHDWRMNAMREVEGMVSVVNELCDLMEYEQPVLDGVSDDANAQPSPE